MVSTCLILTTLCEQQQSYLASVDEEGNVRGLLN